MAENEERIPALKTAGVSRPASNRSTSALSDLKASVAALPSLETPITSRTDLIDKSLYDVKLKELSALDIKKMERQITSPIPTISRACL